MSDENDQGISIWIFIGVFVLLVLTGLIVVLIVGSPTSDSKPGRTATPVGTGAVDATRPEGQGDGDGSTVPTSPPAVTAVTLPDGSPAPDGASSVELSDRVLTITFAVDKSELGSTALAKVPPLVAVGGDGPTELDLRIGCSSSRREQLSQLILTETDESVRVSAVVLVPTNATGCNPNDAPTRMTLPLTEPLAGRTLSVESQDLDLPTVDLDTIDD